MATESLNLVEFEIVLSGNHSDIYVCIQAPSDINEDELLALAIEEAMRKTYVWSKKTY